MFNQLTFSERKRLAHLREQGSTPSQIADQLGRDRSTIYRELARNTLAENYTPQVAQQLAVQRRHAPRRSRKLDDRQMHRYVLQRLKQSWSPEQIAGRSQRDFPRSPRRRISKQTIYNWINERQPEWKQYLRRGGKRPEKRGKLRDCVRVKDRPEVINKLCRYGDWEGDTIIGKGRRSALLTLVERKSGCLQMHRLDDLSAATTANQIVRELQALPNSLRRSVTFDNGKEFADHQRLTKRTGIQVYFADVYCSWQRGRNENTNGLIRQYFPKATDFRLITHQEIARVENELNHRPRRRLGFRTPYEILSKYQCCN